MFSPEATGASSVAARNPRRRQRTSSDDSIAIRPNPKRIRRSNLTHETFLPPDAPRANGHAKHAIQIHLNGHAEEHRGQRQGSVENADLVLKRKGVGKPNRERKAGRNDGSVELTRNKNYVVTHLPTTPQVLESTHNSEPWHGEVSTVSGYAIAMTQTQAIIWRYTQGGSSSVENLQPLKVQLHNSTNDPRKPLPLGILIPTSGEPALLVVMPTSGKVMFWESLSTATISDPKRQKQQSVQGTVTGMMSGEVVSNITEAEPRGFVVTLSTGRLAHLTIADTQGRAAISVQYLRSGDAQKGGVFGSLRGVFSSAAWKKNIAAVRASHSLQRGQRFIVAATTSANFQIWDLNWNGTGSLVHDIDAREDILKALSEGAEIPHDYKNAQFELLDFTLLPDGAGKKDTRGGKAISDCTIMALTVIKGRESSKYALVGLRFTEGVISIDVVHPISCYTTSISAEATSNPRVLVPEPAQTAFVIFEKSTILVSLVEIEESPDSQLQMEAHALPDPFQDSIDFKRSKPYRVVGSSAEISSQVHESASCIVMIYGFGIIRITALPIEAGQSATDRKTVTAETKLEQAIFFGGLRQDLLDFTPRPEMNFSLEEIEQAALDVSKSIMTSSSLYLPKLGPSMELQLSRRAQALADLNKHLRQYFPTINQAIKWQLLINAEKMAAAQEMWRCYDESVRNPVKTSDPKNLFTEVCNAAHPNYRVKNRPEEHETDAVRHWFTHDIWRLEWTIPYAEQMVATLIKESIEDRQELDLATKARITNEAASIQLAALETAFKFRETNAPIYGLDKDSIQDGYLQNGYENIPEEVLWTSNPHVVKSVRLLTDIAREFASMLDDPPSDNQIVEGSIAEALLIKLAAENPRQVQLALHVNFERYKWQLAQDDLATKAEGEKRKQDHVKLRRRLLTQLGEIAQTEPAILLAEKYHDMDALADIIENELGDAEVDELQDALQQQIKSNFVKFGTSWANAFFSKHLVGTGLVDILNQDAISKQYLTNFLRSHTKTYARIGWLNEVTAEQNFRRAADFLEDVQNQSDHVWSRKIVVNMRRLSLVTAHSQRQVSKQTADSIINTLDQMIDVLAIQEELYSYIEPSVDDGIDAEAKGQLAMERHGNGLSKGQITYPSTLRRGFDRLLSNQVLTAHELIDILTLIGVDQATPDPASFIPTRFFAALKILRLDPVFTSPDSNSAQRGFYERVIWRRCMIYDDWPALNRTENKPDSITAEETSQTALFQTLCLGYREGFWDQSTPPHPINEALYNAGTSEERLRRILYYQNTSDNQLPDIASDMLREAERLETCASAGRLEDRWAGIVDDARLAVRAEADRKGEHQAELLATEMKMAKSEAERFGQAVNGVDGVGSRAGEEKFLGSEMGKHLTSKDFWGL